MSLDTDEGGGVIESEFTDLRCLFEELFNGVFFSPMEDSVDRDEKKTLREIWPIKFNFIIFSMIWTLEQMPQLMSALDYIKQYTTIVADTGDFEGSV